MYPPQSHYYPANDDGTRGLEECGKSVIQLMWTCFKITNFVISIYESLVLGRLSPLESSRLVYPTGSCS